MSDHLTNSQLSRRELFGTVGKALVLTPLVGIAAAPRANAAPGASLTGVAGIDRVTVLGGKTYLRGWVGYGDQRDPGRGGRGAPPPPVESGPAATVTWSKYTGPGTVTFADAHSAITTATFSAPGAYVLRLAAENGEASSFSTLNVSVEPPPPAQKLDAVYTKNFKIDSPLWNARAKALMVSWIPHCVDQINRNEEHTSELQSLRH